MRGRGGALLLWAASAVTFSTGAALHGPAPPTFTPSQPPLSHTSSPRVTSSPPPCADTYFCVVDLHAITMPHDPAALLASTHSSAALYIACGLDPAKSNIFVQSHVPAHAEMTWLLRWVLRGVEWPHRQRRGQGGCEGALRARACRAPDVAL